MRYLCIIFLTLFLFSMPANSDQLIRYVALGDSYTIGTGATPEESWPAVVTERLQQKGVPIELVANLGHNGWIAQNLIDGELPELKKLKPDFVTLLIGTNDWVQGVDEKTYEEHFRRILDELLTQVAASKILVVTSPDFSVSPQGAGYGSGRNIAEGMDRFNQIAKKEAKARKIKIVDVYPLSQTMKGKLSFFAEDGLHPSAKGYKLWADLIEPAFPMKVN